ncbi:tyrosine-type recombinase/integrase [Flavobacterium maritimum]|uniref:tyrosine-type recombinase/integrase n=1 Tax=Flavobacterium maritimum TaxID=3149042 RepID=UPI0032B49C03
MRKLTMPKNPYKGIKIYCKKCKVDNPKCNHFESFTYKVRIHIPGTKKSVKSKILNSTVYSDAVTEAINFEKHLKSNNYETIVADTEEGNDYSVIDSIIKYNHYLNGESEYAQFKKNVTVEHRKELIRFCKYFAKTLKKNKNIELTRIKDVSKQDVSNFYSWADNHYNPKTFNKCLNGVKGFFDFLIDVEEIEMKNPFRKYSRKQIPKTNIDSVTKEEFNAILEAVDIYSPIVVLGGKGERKNMYKPYLKDGFRLFLLTGGRREEIVDLRWSHIYVSVSGVKFFRVQNLKVERNLNIDGLYKYIPINSDLFDLLVEMGYHEKKQTGDYILFPEREVQSKTIMDSLSKAFSHYKNGAGIEKDISLKSLRKTYITWVYQVMQKETGVLTSHSTTKVLESYYIDPQILSVVEKGAIEIKIFGADSSL